MDPARRPPLLVAVVVLVALEAALLLGVAAVYAVRAVAGLADPLLVALVTAALAVVIGGFLLLASRGLWRGRRWARAPVVTWQLLQLAVSVQAVGGGARWGGGVLLAASVAVLAGLFTPAVVRATASTADPPVT